jgi:outer membrane protein OmpA-like peptidoglycan-associated protein
MVDRSSTIRGLTLASLVQPVPLPAKAPHGFDPCYVAGEDAPFWLAMGFAVLGTLFALALASAWQQSGLNTIQMPVVAALPPERLGPKPDQQPEPPAVPAREAPIPSPQARLEPANPLPREVKPTEPVITPAVVAPPSAAPLPMPDRQAAADCFHPLSIPFDRNSVRPASRDIRKLLGPLQRWLSGHRDAIVLIEGHSDATGTEDHNVLLSYSRGKAIASLLKNEGIRVQQMTIRAAGPGEAVGDARAAARDRNAVLRIAGVEDCGDHETATKRP